MTLRLDEMMEDLRQATPSAPASELDAGVWRGIARARASSANASLFLPVQAAAVVAALGLGIAGGTFAAAAAAPTEISAFSPTAHLAPSSLLEDVG